MLNYNNTFRKKLRSILMKNKATLQDQGYRELFCYLLQKQHQEFSNNDLGKDEVESFLLRCVLVLLQQHLGIV